MANLCKGGNEPPGSLKANLAGKPLNWQRGTLPELRVRKPCNKSSVVESHTWEEQYVGHGVTKPAKYTNLELRHRTHDLGNGQNLSFALSSLSLWCNARDPSWTILSAVDSYSRLTRCSRRNSRPRAQRFTLWFANPTRLLVRLSTQLNLWQKEVRALWARRGSAGKLRNLHPFPPLLTPYYKQTHRKTLPPSVVDIRRPARTGSS
ncbi:hypothetical protein ANN_08189 [Periplaneta americana]|uniref:Uncharacterized protein n=1 Tax=Periplaneta americana TaxID=6978 RepID=A0ABQ8T240_PERAM|nr:hypothetical protein ANN_08189 [Periplaneta americana]